MTGNQRRAEKFLLDIRNMDKEIDNLICKIDYLRYKASGAGAIRYDKDRVQTSPEDMVCEAITEVIEQEQKLSAYIRKIQRRREYTKQVIELWNNNNAQYIDIYYLNHGSIFDVSSRIGCSNRQAYRIRDNALEQFARYIQDIV